MILKTIFARVAKQRPRLCKALGEQNGVALLRAVLDFLLGEIHRIDEGNVAVHGFGEFQIRVAADGQKTVTFVPHQKVVPGTAKHG